MRGFQKGLIFEICPSGFGDIWILVLQKWDFSRQDLKGSYISEMAPKRRFLKGSCNSLGINTHNFVKKDRKFKNKSLLDAKFYGGWSEKKLGLKLV